MSNAVSKLPLEQHTPNIPVSSSLERTVWMLWLQGFENAPEIVQVCLRSWKKRNPTWRVVELSDENLSDYIDSDSLATLKSLDIKLQKLANLIRLYLISTHGGVWVDATCFCCQPLDSWLPDYMASGFFAFRNPGPDRILANWFLAAKKGNPLASIFYEKHLDYFRKNRFPLQHTKKGRDRVRRINSVMNRSYKLAEWWASPLLIRTVKAYPYFIFHYHFARTVRQNAVCGDIWSRTPFFSSDGPRKMNKAGILSPMPARLLEDLVQLKDPLYKLT
jgi:hypothetical protein